MSNLLPALEMPPLTGLEPVLCQACDNWFAPNASWRCPCGAMAAYGVQPGTCPDCHALAPAVRAGNVVRSLCRCRFTAAERLRLEARWRELDREDREVADLLAGRRPRTSGQTTLADDAPVRDWWPDLAAMVPAHIDRAAILDHAKACCNDFSLARVVDALRCVLERIQRRQTAVNSPKYITGALERELGR